MHAVQTEFRDVLRSSNVNSAVITESGASLRVNQKGFKGMSEELNFWRNEFNIQKAKSTCLELKKNDGSSEYIWTMAVLCSGGCLDTIAGIRAGFNPIWGSEINAQQAAMFEDLTGGVCLGDTFGDKVSNACKVKYLKSGQPCPNFARSGNHLGSSGESGWMFVEQAEVILKLLPWAFCLEISDFASAVNNGSEFNQLRARLEGEYVIHEKLISVWWFGIPQIAKDGSGWDSIVNWVKLLLISTGLFRSLKTVICR